MKPKDLSIISKATKLKIHFMGVLSAIDQFCEICRHNQYDGNDFVIECNFSECPLYDFPLHGLSEGRTGALREAPMAEGSE
jgi:hypothetical protein